MRHCVLKLWGINDNILQILIRNKHLFCERNLNCRVVLISERRGENARRYFNCEKTHYLVFVFLVAGGVKETTQPLVE